MTTTAAKTTITTPTEREIRIERVVHAPPDRVFAALSDPRVLDAWWTLRSSGTPKLGDTYELFFGDMYDWRATVTRCEPGKAFELQLTKSDGDWNGSRVSVELEPTAGGTHVRFAHRGL